MTSINILRAEIVGLEGTRDMLATRIARRVARGAVPGEWDVLRFQVAEQTLAERRRELESREPSWFKVA